MTERTASPDSRIDRRTVLALAGSSLTALAGCGGSSPSGGNSTSSGGTPSPEQSDLIKSLSYTDDTKRGGPLIKASIELIEDHQIRRINLISDGKQFDFATLNAGETKAEVDIATGTGDVNRINPANSKLVLVGESTTEVPISYQTDIQFKEVLTPKESDKLEVARGDGARDVGVVFENTSDKPDILLPYTKRDDPAEVYTGSTEPDRTYGFNKVVPAQGEAMLILKGLLDGAGWDCSGIGTVDMKLICPLAFDDRTAIKIPIQYKPKRDYVCDVTIDGSVKKYTPSSPVTEHDPLDN